jgi:hypothetical protein
MLVLIDAYKETKKSNFLRSAIKSGVVGLGNGCNSVGRLGGSSAGCTWYCNVLEKFTETNRINLCTKHLFR